MLSKDIGGRSDVVATPMTELLGHLISLFEKQEREAYTEQVDYYMEFMSRLHANPSNEKQMKQTTRFIENITPPKKDKGVNEKRKQPEWSPRVQEKIEARQRAEQNK